MVLGLQNTSTYENKYGFLSELLNKALLKPPYRLEERLHLEVHLFPPASESCTPIGEVEENEMLVTESQVSDSKKPFLAKMQDVGLEATQEPCLKGSSPLQLLRAPQRP